MPESTPLVIGITGQIGAGKSTVGTLFARHGFHNLEVDEVGHAVLQRPAIRDAVAAAFGPAVVDGQGGIDRRELGRLVFADPAARARLNAIVHPPMIAEVERRVRETTARDGVGVIVNAALLYEMGLDRLCRRIIYVRAASDTRLQRIVTHRGLPLERARARLAAQDQEPVGDSRVVFCDNDGSLDHLQAWVDRTLAEFTAAHASPTASAAPAPPSRTEMPRMNDSRELPVCPSAPGPSLPENFEPHTDCTFDNPSLGAVVEHLAQVDPLPHCGLSHLIDGVFLVPVGPDGSQPLVGPDGVATLFSSMALGRASGPGSGRHIHARLRHLLASPAAASIRGFAIARPGGAFLHLGPELIDKLRALAAARPGSGPSESRPDSVEIAAGESLIISPPDLPVPAEFLAHLRQVGRRHPAVVEIFLFDAAISGRGDSLIVGVLPAVGATAEAFDRFWGEAMAGVEARLADRSCVDFLVLDDPALLEIVSTTVEPIGVRS